MRYGPRNVLLCSLILIALALLLATRTPVDTVYARDILPMALLLGAGGGLGLPAVMTLAMAVRSPAHAGIASGLVGTSRMIGDALGIAAMTAIAAARTGDLLAEGRTAGDALNEGFHLAFGVAAAVLIAALAVAYFALPRARTGPQGAAPDDVTPHPDEPAVSTSQDVPSPLAPDA